MQVITDTSTLEQFCNTLYGDEYITIDTEFMRERTYWSRLCLVQVASPSTEAIIDPLASGIDLKPLLDVLANKDVVKVFHAARQDVEIFYKLMGSVPQPLFDTQIAAMACGHGDQIGYEPLVRSVTGASIDKGSRFTDWSRRPLSDKQLNYALGDVTHLRGVYTKLRRQLEEQDRFHWVQEEMDALLNPELYFVTPKDAWQRMKTRNLKQRELGPLMMVAKWREEQAQGRDVPRSRVLKDDAVIELSRQRPTSKEALAKCRSVPQGFQNSGQAQSLIEAIRHGCEIPTDDLPKISRQSDSSPVPTEVVELLRVLLKRQCEYHQVAPKLIASASDLETIARHDAPDVPAMKGWRREVFGESAMRLKRGKLGLKLVNNTIEFMDTE